MKLYIYLILFISICIKNTYEENIFETLIRTFITTMNETLNSTKKDNDDTEDEETDIIEEHIYEMNSTNSFDLNIKINGTNDNALIILFYSKTCVHCKKFIPIYREIAESLKNDTTLKFSKIQINLCDEILKKYRELKVPGVPTLFLYRKGNFYRYEGKRTNEKVISFINQIKNFECNEISSLGQLSSFINKKTFFSQDYDNHYILGIFKNKDFNKSLVANYYQELISTYNDIIMKKNCYYFFNDEKNINDNDNNNFYLKQILDKKEDEEGDYLIYSYNYQKGLNTFSLFKPFLYFQSNSSIINQFGNINKNIKIIKNKFRNFLDENYLYKYYTINFSMELFNFFGYENKNFFVFYHQTPKLKKFYVDEINYILSLNRSLACDYMFLLYNTSNDKDVDLRKRVSFFDVDEFENTVLLTEDELNKSSIETSILDHIHKHRYHLLKTKKEKLQDAIKSIYQWFTGNNNQSDLFNLNKDDEQELIDEINKTIIEDEKAQKLLREKEKKNDNITIRTKNLKNFRNNIKRKKIIEVNLDEELGFNKNLILFPFFLIIYSFLFFFCYKYIFSKYESKILYKRLPSEEAKFK